MSVIQTPAIKPKGPFMSMKGHHVAVRVPSFERAITWYIDKLDFRVLRLWAYGVTQLAFWRPRSTTSRH